ncbi:hypothetical protein, partial [Raoultella ornithinolytica]
MIGKIRTVLAFGCVVAATVVLVPLQLISMKTRLWPETFILKIWHRAVTRALGIRVHTHGTLSNQR